MSEESAGGERLTPEERSVSMRLSQGFAWPTVVLLVGLIATGVCVTATAVSGRLPLLAGLFINSLVGYGLYTVVHEAAHRSISGRNPTFARWDVICGNIAAQLILLNFAGHRASHLRHHAHTNTERDPDLGAKGPLAAIPVKWFIGNIVLLLVALPRGVRLANALMARLGATKASEGGDDSLLAPQRWAIRLGIGAILVSIPFGALVPVVVLWVIPARLTFLYLAVFFVWLPHYPYEHTDRFRNTRITLFLAQAGSCFSRTVTSSITSTPQSRGTGTGLCIENSLGFSPNAARLWRARQANRASGCSFAEASG